MDNTIYIHTLGKHITMDEFNAYLPKIGEDVVINKNNFLRRVADSEHDNLRFEQIVSLNVTDEYVNAGTIQNCYNTPESVIMPSLDLVNRIADGTYKAVDGNVFDMLLAEIKNCADVTQIVMSRFV